MKYKKGILKKMVNNDGVIIIKEEDLLGDIGLVMVERPILRTGGEFAGKGFYVSKDHDWQLIEDSDGLLVLVPTYPVKKEAL